MSLETNAFDDPPCPPNPAGVDADENSVLRHEIPQQGAFSPQTCLAQTLRRIFASRRYNLRQNQLRGPFRIRPLPRRQRLTPRPHGALRLLQPVLQWSYEGTTPPLHQCLTDLLRPTNLLRWPQRLHCLPDLVRMVWMPQPNLLQLAMDLLLPRRLVMGLCTFCI